MNLAKVFMADVLRQQALLDVSDDALAAAGNIAPRTFRKYRKEPTAIRLDTLERMCRLLKITVRFELSDGRAGKP